MPVALASVRERWTAFAGSFVALCLGVAIVTAAGLAYVSAEPRVPDRLAGAPVLVRAPTPVQPDGVFAPDRAWPPEEAEALARRLAGVPGVAAAVADRSFYAQAVIGGRPVGLRADLQGHGWAAAALGPYRLASGTPPAGERDVVVDRELGLRAGEPVTLLTAAGPAAYRVSGTVDGPGFYVSDAAAARLAGGVRVIGLVTEPGADPAAVEAAARAAAGTRGTVLAGDARAAVEPKHDSRTRWIGTQVLAGMAALAAFVSVFIVASTFAFGVAQRRREFGLLRAIGATPRQVRVMMYGEALAVGTVAGAAGAALGIAAASPMGGLLVAAGFEPPGFEVRVAAWPPAAAFAVGLVVALLGTWAASRRAARVRPLEALREAAVDERPMPRSRWIFGIAFTAGGVVLSVLTVSAGAEAMFNYGIYTAMALIVGLTLLAPAVVPPLAHALTWPLGRARGATGMLVRENARVAARRTASTAAPVLATVGFAMLITSMVQTTAAAFAAGRGAAVSAAAVVAPDGTPGLSDAAVAAAGAVAGLPGTVYHGDTPLDALGLTPGALRVARDLRAVAGDLGRLRGDTVAVASRPAGELGLRPGDTLPVTFDDGRTVPLTVVAVTSGAPASLLLPRDTLRAHDPSALTAEAYVAGGATPPALPPELGARVLSVAAYAASADAEEDRLVWTFTLVLVGMSAGYTAVAIGNTLLMATSGRRRDFAVLSLSGATVRQVLAAVAGESALVVTLGTLLGALAALPALLGLRAGLAELAGAPVELVLPWPLLAGIVAACLLLALAASVLPARLAVRRR
ncbi:ABC transporter permease [Thermocatellispora tengchongensis]